jgi:hypothetical protein
MGQADPLQHCMRPRPPLGRRRQGRRASSTLACTESRNIFGCWKTIVTPNVRARPPPQSNARIGLKQAAHTAQQTLLPAPLGPGGW